ncbi:MAG: cytochrome c biogenesis protein ResB [Bacteroidales bacterium]|nr:cytochrome c biogenesis protein ResB [Bacteroidales bacterium]
MTNSRPIWQKPWSYKEGFSIALGLLLVGLLLNEFTIIHFRLPSWPWNFVLGLFFLLLLIAVKLFLGKRHFIMWLSSLPAAISSICLFLVIVLAMGLIPQQEAHAAQRFYFDLNTLKNSWLFFLGLIYLLTTLGLTIFRRIIPFRGRNIAFTLQHGGLWILAFTAGLASADVERYQIPVYENQTVEHGYSVQGQYIQFPFKIQLIDFSIDEFPAKLAVVNSRTNEIDAAERGNLNLITEGLEVNIYHFTIKVLKYYPSALEKGDTTYVPSNDSLSGQAALLEITDNRTGEKYTGWISSGSPLFQASYIQIGDYYIAMTIPQPKKFSSVVKIMLPNKQPETYRIAVNQPLKIAGWKLYQIGYDENMGKYSKLSVLEAVRDPWLPFVYTGILLLMMGAAYLFWTGNKINTKTENHELG